VPFWDGRIFALVERLREDINALLWIDDRRFLGEHEQKPTELKEI
jgi:hypothetical protein